MVTVAESCNKLPKWLISVTIGLLIVRVVYSALLPCISDKGTVHWREFESVSEQEVLSSNKPVLMLVTHGASCEACRKAEETIKPATAQALEKNFIAVKILRDKKDDPDEYTWRLNKNKEKGKKAFNYFSAPCLIRIEPTEWTETPDVKELWHTTAFSFNAWASDISQSTPYHSLQIGGYANWRTYATAEEEHKRTGKPLLLFFCSTRDKHCTTERGKILTDEKVRKLIEEKCIPVQITDCTRSGLKNSPETVRLLDQYKIRSYPTVVLLIPDKRPIPDRSPTAESIATLLESQLDEQNTVARTK